MKIEDFKDTDPALFEFSSRTVDEAKEISENVYVDLDHDGNLVRMTIEHAARVAALPQLSLEETDAPTA
jgi:uncharacterized protein YuzE